MLSEFQKKLQEVENKIQDGLSEFQRKMLEREQEEERYKKANIIRANLRSIDFTGNEPLGYTRIRTRIAST